MSSNSVIPSGTILRFARDTKFHHSAVVLNDGSVLQVKNLENPGNARQHFASVGEWVAHLEITSKCTNFLNQQLSIENLEHKIDDTFVVEDLIEEASDNDSDNESECECDDYDDANSDEEYVGRHETTNNNVSRRSSRLSKKERVNYAESDNEEEVNNTTSNTRTNTSSNTNNRTNTSSNRNNTRTNTSSNIRTSSRLSSKPRVNYTELADE
jgi:hypothetical protein